MNFFGIEISDAQFEAAHEAAWAGLGIGYVEPAKATEEKILDALGFKTGDVAEDYIDHEITDADIVRTGQLASKLGWKTDDK